MRAFRFRVPLVRPLTLKGSPCTVREGVLLERDGKWAEASPLPGFSVESIDDVVAALRGERPVPASLSFALSALDESELKTAEVPCNVLLLGVRENVLYAASRCCELGYRAVKLKVGRQSIQDDIELVKDVADRLSDNIRLRLDANQAWTLTEAEQFIEGIAGVELEYIEEPLQDPQQLESFYAQTGVPYAIDESLLQLDGDLNTNDQWPNAVALVCKPTILGGRDRVERLAANGKPIVFSAAFESGVGIARIVQLAAEFSPAIAAGLDTLSWFGGDFLVAFPKKQNGMFRVEGEPVVDENRLERIEL